jgi:16S rRNA (cytosine967-C5)-methyltransferase
MHEAPSAAQPPHQPGKPGLATRRLVLDALLQTDRGAFAGDWIARHGQDLSPADRGLALEIALTTLRWKRLLDHNLEPWMLRWPGARVGWILRMALAQVWMLDRIPVHAAVDLSVSLARQLESTGSAGLVNAVLRHCIEAGLVQPVDHDARSLAIRHSHPEWLVRRWLERLGPERTVERLEADNRTPPVWVRVRPGAEALPWSDGQILSKVLDGRFLRLDASRQDLLASDAFAQGSFSFQDPASGCAALALSGRLEPGQAFVDLCCAPGGKSALLHESGQLEGVNAFACDLSLERQERTVQGFERLHAASIAVVCADGTRPPFRPKSLDAILLDAPCSNLGVLSRRPEARWRARPEDLVRQAGLQRDLVYSSLKLLKPGGLLAYSTCTVEPEETVDLIGHFLSNGRAEAIPLPASLAPLDGAPEPSPFLQVHPGHHGWDGFFVALLRKPL